MNSNFISVIVPVFNGENFIDGFIKNFLNQKYKNFEIVFINDGSTDLTLVKLKKIPKTIESKIISTMNGGVSKARNIGIEYSKYELLCFCDIDDIVSPDYLLDFIETFNKYKCDLVLTNQLRVQNYERNENIFKKTNVTKPKRTSSKKLLKKNLFQGLKIGVCTLLVKKEIIHNHKIIFPENYNYNEDLYFLWKLISFSKIIYFINKFNYLYFNNPHSAMHIFDEKRIQGFQLMQSLNKFFKNHDKFFYFIYVIYGASRIAWSITWQAAYFLNYNDFYKFIKKFKLKNQIVKTTIFPNLFIIISSFAFLLHPFIFYILIKLYKRVKKIWIN